MANLSDLNQQFIIEGDGTGSTQPLSACTGLFANTITSCSGNTAIDLGTGIIVITGNTYTLGAISGTSFYSGGTNLLDMFTHGIDNYTTGATLTNRIVYFDTVSSKSAYTLSLSAFTTSDTYVTGGTYSNGTAVFSNNTGGTFNVSGFSTGLTGVLSIVAGDNIAIDSSDPENPIVTASFNQTGKYMISGGASWSGTGYTYYVSILTYFFNGNKIASATTITLASSNILHDRIDAIVVDENGVVSIIQGDPAENPITPEIPDDQLLVQYVIVYANTTEPITLTEAIYLDNAEWVTSNYQTTGSPVGSTNFASTNSPKQGTVCITNIRNATTGDKFVRTTPLTLSGLSVMTLWVRFAAIIPSTKNLTVRFQNSAGALIGNNLNIFNYGVLRTVTNTWQLAVIPVTAFGAITTIQGLRIILAGNPTSTLYNWDLDYILLSSGTVPQSNVPTISFYKDGLAVGTESSVDIKQGSGMSITGVLNTTLNRVEYTFSTTGNTSGNNVLITGGTTNNSTKTYTFTNSTGGTFTVAGLTDITITGGTYSNGTATFTNNTGGTFTINGFNTTVDTCITGATTNNSNKTYTLTNSTGGTIVFTGLTDIYVTGGTYSNGTATITNNTGGTFSINGFSTSIDSYVTGVTTNNSSKTYTIINSTGGTIIFTGLTDISVTGFTASNGTYTLTNNTGGTLSVVALPDVFITGGTANNGPKTYTFTNNTGGTFTVTALTDLTITGGTYSNGTATFTNNTGGTFNVTGFSATSGSGTITGGGTTNYITKFTGSTAIGNSLIYDDGAHIGIGQSSPTAVLHLKAGTATANTAPLKLTSGTLMTTTEAGAQEFLTDDYYGTITTGAGIGFSTDYPPVQSGTYVKATLTYDSTLQPYFATDPAKSLTGSYINNSWLTTNVGSTNQRFHIDLGSTKTITRIYYENQHFAGGSTNQGVQNFTFWGSNDATAFSTLTYATDTNWTQLSTASSVFLQHVASDVADPKYIIVTNTTAYRYYAFKFADNWGDSQYMGVRRIELQEGGTARKGFILNDGPNLVTGRIPYATTNGRLIDSSKLVFNGTNLGVGQSSPTALLHLAAGTAAANSAPLKFTSGINLTTPEIGTVEYNGTNLFFTRTGTTRETIFVGTSGATAPTNAVTVASWAQVVINGVVYKMPLYQ